MGLVSKLVNKLKYGNPVIIVSGLPRSGTSMMMQMLAAGGLTIGTDKTRAADEDNPKGYYELEKVKELDKGGDNSWMRNYKGQVVKVISYLLRHLPLELNYMVIFLDREIDEVLASQRKMLVRRGKDPNAVDDETMKKSYAKHLNEVEQLFATNTANFKLLRLDHRQVLAKPEDAAQRINDFLRDFIGGSLDVRAMAEIVDKSLYRNRGASES